MPAGRSRVDRAYALLRTHGLRAGGLKILEKAAKRVYCRAEYIVVEKRLERRQAHDPCGRRSELIAVREGSQAEILEFTSTITNCDRKANRRALAYLSRKYNCALGFDNGVPVGQFWWTDPRPSAKLPKDADLQIQFFEIALKEGDAWCFKFEVLSSWRGRGRATAFLEEFEDMLARRGYRRLVGYVHADNIPARWIYEIRGFRPVRSVRSKYLLSLIGISNGRLVIKVNERRRFETFPYRPVTG
jgi:GNAT superfamily N-acetyltransferase